MKRSAHRYPSPYGRGLAFARRAKGTAPLVPDRLWCNLQLSFDPS